MEIQCSLTVGVTETQCYLTGDRVYYLTVGVKETVLHDCGCDGDIVLPD